MAANPSSVKEEAKQPADSSSLDSLRSNVDRTRGPNWANLWPLALAPVFPMLAIGLRKYPQYRTHPAVFGLAGGILFGAHHMGMTVGVDTK